MHILIWIIFGGIVGWLASIVTGHKDRMGCFSNIFVGLVGALIGGWIASWTLGGGIRTFSWPGLFFSVLGAVLFLMLLHLLTPKKFR